MGWGSGTAVSCGVGCRCGLDLDPMLLLLLLWRRLVSTPPIRPPAWEPPYARGSGPRKGKETKKKKKEKEIHILKEFIVITMVEVLLLFSVSTLKKKKEQIITNLAFKNCLILF